MKKMLALCLSTLFAVSALTGCGKTAATVSPAEPTVTLAPSPAAEAVKYPVVLTEVQLGNFQTALTNQENYGFLLCDYSDVSEVDLTQVFYTGAGMSNPENSDKIIQAYIAKYGDNGSDTDSTILTTKQINDFLSSKTGCTLTDMKKPLSWRYVKEYDAYVHYHGDTNYVRVSCAEGREISENLFEVNYTIPGGIADNDGKFLTGGTVTFKMSGDKIQFVSNSAH